MQLPEQEADEVVLAWQFPDSGQPMQRLPLFLLLIIKATAPPTTKTIIAITMISIGFITSPYNKTYFTSATALSSISDFSAFFASLSAFSRASFL